MKTGETVMTEYLKKFLKDGPVYMTQEEGMSLADMGLIEPDVAQVSPINPNAVLVNLTDAGQKRLDEIMKPDLPLPPVQPNAPVEVKEPSLPAHWAISDGLPPTEMSIQSEVKIDSDVPVPKMKRVAPKSKRKSRYPFDQLEEGQSFHLAVTEDQPKPWKTIAPFLTAANTKSKIPVEPQEMVTAVDFTNVRSTIDILSAVVRQNAGASTQSDIAISRISRDTFINIPSKRTTARPSQFYIDRQITPVVKLWGTPDATTYTLVFDRLANCLS